MKLSDRHTTMLSLLLLLIQLCLSLSGPGYFYGDAGANEAVHAASACDHATADVDREPREGHDRIVHCHEFDAPCDLASVPALRHSPLTSLLSGSYDGAMLPGYGAPIEFPPKNCG